MVDNCRGLFTRGLSENTKEEEHPIFKAFMRRLIKNTAGQENLVFVRVNCRLWNLELLLLPVVASYKYLIKPVTNYDIIYSHEY